MQPGLQPEVKEPMGCTNPYILTGLQVQEWQKFSLNFLISVIMVQ